MLRERHESILDLVGAAEDAENDELSGVIGGRYRVVRLIGGGGMGRVYEVDDGFGPRALKTLRRDLASQRDMRRRFQDEVDMLKLVRHDSVIRILDSGFDDEHALPYLVTDLLEGRDLDALITDLGRRSSPSLTVRLLSRVAVALDAIHDNGIVHRDLKPSNVFIERRSSGLADVKVLDFGIAKLVDADASGTTVAIGTPEYMAPEQWKGKSIDGRTDIYALGQLARAMLFGRESLRLAADPKRMEEVGGRIGEWLSKATAFDKERRFARASVAVHALAEALGVEDPHPGHIEWDECQHAFGAPYAVELPRSAVRARSPRSRSVVAAAAMGVVVVGILWLAPPKPPLRTEEPGLVKAVPAVVSELRASTAAVVYPCTKRLCLEVPIARGGTKQDVERVYAGEKLKRIAASAPPPPRQTPPGLPPMPPQAPKLPSRPSLRYPELGVRFFFDAEDRVTTIRVEAPFSGAFHGVKLGDTAAVLTQKRGPPLSMFEFGENTAVVYEDGDDTSATTRYDVNSAGIIVTVFR